MARLEIITKEPNIPIPAWQLWVLRLSLFSIPIAFFCSAVYCFVNHVPNPRSVIPKSVICPITAMTFAFAILMIDRQVQTNSISSKEKRIVLVVGPIIVALIWIIAYSLRNNSQFDPTGDGEPVFPILCFAMACTKWLVHRDKHLTSREEPTN